MAQMQSNPKLDPKMTEALEQVLERRAGMPYLPPTGSGAGPQAGLKLHGAAPEPAAASPEMARLMALLDQCPVEQPPEDIVARTLARVERAESAVKESVRVDGGFGAFGGLKIHEIATVAAVLIFSVAMIWPAMSYMREDARRIACANNLSMAGVAFASYATDNTDRLPNRGAVPGSTWWNVGKACPKSGECNESNSANLFQMARTGHIRPDGLNCPENRNAPRDLDPASTRDWPDAPSVSYSYQNQFSPHLPRLSEQNQMAILADKNPLFVARPDARGLRQADVPVTASSRLHRERGQNVLLGNGSVIWATSPVLPNGDNIWLARGVKQYTGNESPASVDDSFLVP